MINLQEHKPKLILVGIIAVIGAGMFLFGGKDTETSKTASSQSAQVSKQDKGTTFLLTELKTKMKDVNPDVVLDGNPSTQGELVFVKFKCSITDESVNKITASMNGGTSIDLKTVPVEQLAVLKKTMESDCNTLNATLVSKGMVFKMDSDALSYKNITPSAYFQKLENVLPVEFTKNETNAQYFKIMNGVFSYENNINNIFSDKVKSKKVAEIYGLLKSAINATKSKDAEIQQLLTQTDSVVEHYTK